MQDLFSSCPLSRSRDLAYLVKEGEMRGAGERTTSGRRRTHSGDRTCITHKETTMFHAYAHNFATLSPACPSSPPPDAWGALGFGCGLNHGPSFTAQALIRWWATATGGGIQNPSDSRDCCWRPERGEGGRV